MYFTDPIDLSSGRHCLKSCPLAGHLLDCPNAGCSTLVSTYNTVQQINRLGAFCVPTDSSLQSKFWSNPLIANKNLLVNSYDIILLSLLIGIGVGTLYLAFMSCIPKSLTKGVFILTFLALVAAGVMILVLPVQIFSNNLYNIIFASLLLVAGLLFLIYFFCYRREIEVASIFLQHANNCLKDTPAIYGYLPLFLLFCFGLLVLCCWQYIAFGTMNGTELRPGDLYYTSKQSLPLEILNFIELIWGLQFLKDASTTRCI